MSAVNAEKVNAEKQRISGGSSKPTPRVADNFNRIIIEAVYDHSEPDSITIDG